MEENDMGKQPYIPLYIGDWEQDTNSLSLKAEGAWLKIIFKMFKNEKSGIYKASTKALQNLWRLNEAEVAEVLDELISSNVGEINKLEGIYEFKNRRMLKEKHISVIRTKAVQTRYKDDTNMLHPLEGEGEYDIEIIKRGAENFSKNGHSEKERVEFFKQDFLSDQQTIESACITNRVDESKLKEGLELFTTTKLNTKESKEWKSEKDFRRNFIYWIPSWLEREKKEIKKLGLSPKRKVDLDP